MKVNKWTNRIFVFIFCCKICMLHFPISQSKKKKQPIKAAYILNVYINTTKLKLYKDNIWMASLSVGAVNLKLFCNLLAVYKIGERFFDRLALICIQTSLLLWCVHYTLSRKLSVSQKRIIFYIYKKIWHDVFSRCIFGADDGNRTRVFSLGS